MSPEFISGIAAGGACIYFFLSWKKGLSLRAEQVSRNRLKEIEDKINRESSEVSLKLAKKRNEFEVEKNKAQVELQKLDQRYQQRKEAIERREGELESLRREVQQREREVAKKLDNTTADEIRVKKVYETLILKLEQISEMKRDDAKRVLFDSLQSEVKHETQKWVAKVVEETRLTAKEKSIEILATAMQRYLPEQVIFHSSSIVQLPNEEMKGRIIGKEGRNIKSLEMATGMEFVIGEAPEIISISGFNPIRREVARRTLLKLIQDGRINPTRIEETAEECNAEVEAIIEEMGQQTVLEFDFVGMHRELIKLLGKLHFRTSYSQNVLEHAKEVGFLARMIASELGLSGNIAARCGLLHDIGKAVSAEVDGPHAQIGADLAKKYGEDPIVVNAIAAHHEEVAPTSIYAIITHLADAISASRPGARKETLTNYIKRLEKLEEITEHFPGVKKAYALQAGRELRIIVDESTMDDEKSAILARDIADRIEKELSFPGQIKVNVIREKRSIEYAK